jgi:hypothetical protein
MKGNSNKYCKYNNIFSKILNYVVVLFVCPTINLASPRSRFDFFLAISRRIPSLLLFIFCHRAFEPTTKQDIAVSIARL